MSEGNVPIIGQQRRADFDEIMTAHLQGLITMTDTHKMAIRIGTMELSDHHRTAETPNMIYMEQLKTQIAIHCAAVTQTAAQFALLAAIGIEGVPTSVDVAYAPEGGVQ